MARGKPAVAAGRPARNDHHWPRTSLGLPLSLPAHKKARRTRTMQAVKHAELRYSRVRVIIAVFIRRKWKEGAREGMMMGL